MTGCLQPDNLNHSKTTVYTGQSLDVEVLIKKPFVYDDLRRSKTTTIFVKIQCHSLEHIIEIFPKLFINIFHKSILEY